MIQRQEETRVNQKWSVDIPGVHSII